MPKKKDMATEKYLTNISSRWIKRTAEDNIWKTVASSPVSQINMIKNMVFVGSYTKTGDHIQSDIRAPIEDKGDTFHQQDHNMIINLSANYYPQIFVVYQTIL